MPVMIEMFFPGGTKEQYDKVAELAGFKRGDTAPPNCLWHSAVIAADGMRIVDVWESEEAFNSFFGPMAPMMQEAGVPAPPGPPKVSPVHNHMPGA